MILMVKLHFMCFYTIIDNLQPSVNPNDMVYSTTIIFKYYNK